MNRAASERGSALIFAIVVVLMLLAASSAFLSSSLSHYSAARTALELERATNAAESGLDIALFEVQMRDDFGDDGIGVCAGTIDGSTYSTTIDPPYTRLGVTYIVRSVGSSSQHRKGIEAVVTPGGPRLDWGLFAEGTMTTAGGFSTDSYDSTKGTYASQVGADGFANSNGSIASNGAIKNGGGIIHGNATPGLGYSVSDPAKVTGSTAPSSEPVTLPTYSYAPSVASAGDLIVLVPKTMAPGTYRFSNVSLAGTSTLTLTGNTTLYVDSNFTLSGGCKVVLANGANVQMHHGGGIWSVTGNGIVNKDGIPANLTIFSATSQKFELSGSAEFYGTVFAPYAEFVASGGSGFFGAIIARTASLASANGRLHFDESLTMPVPTPELQLSMVLPFHP